MGVVQREINFGIVNPLRVSYLRFLEIPKSIKPGRDFEYLSPNEHQSRAQYNKARNIQET